MIGMENRIFYLWCVTRTAFGSREEVRLNQRGFNVPDLKTAWGNFAEELGLDRGNLEVVFRGGAFSPVSGHPFLQILNEDEFPKKRARKHSPKPAKAAKPPPTSAYEQAVEDVRECTQLEQAMLTREQIAVLRRPKPRWDLTPPMREDYSTPRGYVSALRAYAMRVLKAEDKGQGVRES